jgi:hypothetical protein
MRTAARCHGPVAFPGLAPQAPELCTRHISFLEPWIAARARQPADAEAWIAHMARKSEAAERQALGELSPLLRRQRTGP